RNRRAPSPGRRRAGLPTPSTRRRTPCAGVWARRRPSTTRSRARGGWSSARRGPWPTTTRSPSPPSGTAASDLSSPRPRRAGPSAIVRHGPRSCALCPRRRRGGNRPNDRQRVGTRPARGWIRSACRWNRGLPSPARTADTVGVNETGVYEITVADRALSDLIDAVHDAADRPARPSERGWAGREVAIRDRPDAPECGTRGERGRRGERPVAQVVVEADGFVRVDVRFVLA